MLKNIFKYLFNKAYEYNKRNILELLKPEKVETLCDLGCDDGRWTVELAKEVKCKKMYGVEIVKSQAERAMKLGVEVKISDLNNVLPFEDNFFDVVHANQVIEHIYNLEKFIREIYRVLKPNGYAIISTENLASWHNIFSLLFGWQPFSATNYLPKSLGNPLSLWRQYESTVDKSWCHDKLWAYKGLIELFETYNFKIEKIKGAGYYPLPASFGNLDRRHSHFITIKARKM